MRFQFIKQLNDFVYYVQQKRFFLRMLVITNNSITRKFQAFYVEIKYIGILNKL